jgi:hypothetical protein
MGAETELNPSVGTDLSQRREDGKSRNLGVGFKPGDVLPTDHQAFDYQTIKYSYQNPENLLNPQVTMEESWTYET